MIKGFDHVHYNCGDIEKSVNYFKDMFDGKEVSRKEHEGFIFIRMNVSGFTIALRGVDPKKGKFEAGKEIRGLDHFGFKVDDMERALTDLVKKGALIKIQPNVSPLGLKYAFIEGPEGSLIELIEEK
jgi:catechol 2,3-dioxygenase-like lactoylglutathione lyase family enzyme